MKRAVGDLELEVLGDLVLVDHAPDALPDRAGVGVVQAPAGVGDRCCDLVQFALGRGEQVLALSRSLGSEVRVAAYHQSLVGELGRGDLGQVGLIEQRELQITCLHQFADLRALQRGHEPRTLLLERLGVRVGDHRPVTDEDHPLDPEPLLDGIDHIGDGGRVGGVPRVHLHRDRPSFRRAHQPPVDLQLARLAVAAVTERGQLTAAALHVAGGQVVEHEPAILQVPARERLLDPLLTVEKPVHRAQQLRLGHLAQRELLAERGLREAPGHRQLRARARSPAGRSSPPPGPAPGSAPARAAAPGPASGARRAPRRHARAGARTRSPTAHRDRPAPGPASILRIASITGSGRCERFPRFSWLTLPPSR